jgi:uncharacterized protein (DUF952 family)
VLIYHIAVPDDWRAALTDGEYLLSTRGRTLAEQGFIHAGEAHQVAGVANRVYGSEDGLIVLVIDVDLLRSELRYDEAPDIGESFPHIYGPLNADAVVATLPLERGPDGTYAFSVDEP